MYSSGLVSVYAYYVSVRWFCSHHALA